MNQIANQPANESSHHTIATDDRAALRGELQKFYGRAIEKTTDLETNACCDVNTMQQHREVVRLIPPRATEKYLGCGSPLPDDLPTLGGLTAVDLGSGSGVDSMILRAYLGESGTMIGIDMTDEQLAIAREAGPEFMAKLGYAPESLRFQKDFIETAESIPDASVDLVISNCVINLSPRKDLVYQTIARILKPGGEFFISDIVADRRVELADDPVLVAECLGLAPYIHDAHDTMFDAGFPDVRVFDRRLLAENPRVIQRGESANFHSVIWRGFKLANMDRRCEDFGQTATYKGNLKSFPKATGVGSPARFILDEGHVFEAGRPAHVCRNTARMLGESRLAPYFDITPPIRHFGLFDECSTPAAGAGDSGGFAGSCC
ncbi:MAG: methyltransferase domain-containing protein [Leptospirales bacterium]|jgi:arsenite methyltransferase